MTDDKFMKKCDLCGTSYQNGPHRYDGRHSELFDIWVCPICWEGNWDGWNPSLEPALLAYLKKNGLRVPERNKKGLFPRN